MKAWKLGNLKLTSHILSKQQDMPDEQKRKDLKNRVIYAPCSDLTSILYNVSGGFGFIKFNQGLKGKQRLGK